MSEREDLEEILERSYSVLPTWAYLALFTIPGLTTFLVMSEALGIESLLSAVTALAVMNGSINSVIAWLTIRLDGQSAEALEHLDTITKEMDRLEKTMEEANTMVATFTDDLEEARRLFRKVGVSLDELDLEPVADVVEKLKENKDGINDILDNLRDVDVNEYINQAKRIEWKELLNGAEEIMGFIKSSDGKPLKVPSPSIGMPKLPTLPTPEPIPEPSVEDLLLSMDDEEEDSWFDDEDDEEWFEEQPQPKEPSLKMKRSKPKKEPNLKMKR
jgi:hypothetical protein